MIAPQRKLKREEKKKRKAKSNINIHSLPGGAFGTLFADPFIFSLLTLYLVFFIYLYIQSKDWIRSSFAPSRLLFQISLAVTQKLVPQLDSTDHSFYVSLSRFDHLFLQLMKIPFVGLSICVI